MSVPLRVLIVEDSEDDAALVVRHLSRGGFDVAYERVDNARDMREALRAGEWEIVISDCSMPRFDGLAAVAVMRELDPDTPIIIISGTVGEDVAAQAVKQGAHDYIMKDNLIRLVPSIERELRDVEMRKERRRSELRLARLSLCLLNLGMEPARNIDSIVSTALEILEGDVVKYWRMAGAEYSLQVEQASIEGYEASRRKMERESMEGLFMWHRGPTSGEGVDASSLREADPDIVRYGLANLLAHPVMLKEEIVGCLCVFAREEGGFSRERIDLAGMVAKAISIEEERWADEMGLRDFIEVASHELRHPITVMKGYAVTLREMGCRMDSAALANALDAIDRGADRLVALLGNLLDTTRIERGELPIARKEVRLDHLIDAALRDIGARYEDRPFDVDLGGEPVVLKADPRRVSQLLEALLDNAAKFSPSHCRIGLRAEVKGEEVEVSVLDRGKGVPEEEREKVFWRFYQVEEVRHHSLPGIGLGLYIAKRIVEAHGGRIWYRPREGGGSAFSFSLPL